MSERLALLGGKPIRNTPFPAWPIFGPEEEKAVAAVVRSGKWGRLAGEEVARFEKRFAEYQQAKHAVAVVNGTVAIRLALIAGGIQAGDEVIVPPYTFLATASAVVECNAVPVFADLELETFNLDPAAVEAAITPRTRAIIPVHLAGLPVNLEALNDIARRHNLLVIEDAAHAHGAEYKGRRVGAIGNYGTFSFQSSKNLTSGEGGIIVTNDDELAARCRSVHNCGRLPGRAWYEHFTIGGNYRLSEFQGAILNAQFDRLPEQVATRNRNGSYLAGRLARIPGLYPQVRTEDCGCHSYHLFALRMDPTVFGVSRDRFVQAITAEGVPAIAGYMIPLYRQPLFQDLAFGPYTAYKQTQPDLDYRRVSCPNCEEICYRQGVWLEQRFMLGTRQDMDDIADAFQKVYDQRQSLATEG